SYSNTTALGELLYTRYAYPFELAGVVLLIAIVAAIALTMRRRPGYKLQDVSRQVATRPQDRLRIVRMKAETAAADSGTAQSPASPSAAPEKRPLEAELEKRP
ncbi:MAG: NADH-quinone oxidoreductase subunit J, partial [Steroidobacteraceae bacterium]